MEDNPVRYYHKKEWHQQMPFFFYCETFKTAGGELLAARRQFALLISLNMSQNGSRTRAFRR